MSKTLHEAMVEVDVIDAAGRIIANPKRNAVAASSATVLALAMATERMWEICIEAELLARAVRLPITGDDHNDHLRDDTIQHQLDRVTELMAALRGEPSKSGE
ncbi:hypothetical protein [Mesorhizobium sp. 2RAF21]|uniref:hypothetical protein n=1 Tax=Mesorhizobium sp. 2RAF21 TaxID=3232995 RepID=UPI003F999898